MVICNLNHKDYAVLSLILLTNDIYKLTISKIMAHEEIYV